MSNTEIPHMNNIAPFKSHEVRSASTVKRKIDMPWSVKYMVRSRGFYKRSQIQLNSTMYPIFVKSPSKTSLYHFPNQAPRKWYLKF